MLKAIRYTNKTNSEDVQRSVYTSQAHKEYHEGQHPELISDYDQVDETSLFVMQVIKNQGLDNMDFGKELIADLRAYNLMAFQTQQLTQEQFFSLKSKLATVKDHIEDGSLDFAKQALLAANITEIPSEIVAQYAQSLQDKIDANTAELNPPDTFPQPENPEPPPAEEPQPENPEPPPAEEPQPENPEPQP